ncbi:alpha-2-macroglobulin family protein [Pseudoroseicyclus tamaricis]|uniref:Alpha-2-macroglobulin family protein n=1 Tax=Pseudoroseicyclus tamaricis TaxID=2705421 RepID=A0A6B2JLY2_9RHOB|nr:alpha-2-macroglobulin family protein [Pseudoroseicyclus tamaricis]NDV02581.1 alpha-2-macroglobulin family protein [Pseudoroseicyclus tamaricis]
MSRLLSALCLVLAALLPLASPAQEAMPERHPAISRNVDFYGADLQQIFDTTLDACQAACLDNGLCQAFTFNTRNNSCFLKGGVTSQTPYEGAISADIVAATPDALLRAETRAADLFFLDAGTLAAARELALMIGRHHAADGLTAAELLSAADAQPAGLARWRLTGAALSLSDRADLWMAYGNLARTLDDGEPAQVETARGRAVPALVNAYLRAGSPELQATILSDLAAALEEASRGQEMIPALRLAQSIQPRRDTEAALERAIGLYGFRIVNTDVESDSARPRICAEFSEDLVQAGVDYAPYVQLPDQSLTVEVDGRQLCVDGVTHGSRYRLIFRPGLPAASGEELPSPVEIAQYVRDRSPGVHFPSRAYVLPARGDVALPVESVNLDGIDLTLYAVSDRNIIRAMQEDVFSSTLPPWTRDYFADEIGTEIWEGTAELEAPLNEDVTTRLPMDEALEGRNAGLYVLTAAVPGADPYDEPPAAQWFILSDLGITTMEGADGLTVAIRSLGTARPVEGAEVELLSRANAVLGTAVTGPRGFATFDAGLVRGLGAAAPGLVTVRSGEADMAFLSLTDPAFDLSDRGVEGREAAGPIDVFLTTDRGAYHAGETIWATALMRAGEVEALPGVPLTAILYRPDGVEYARQTSADGVLGGHVFALPVAETAPRGTWRIEMKTDMETPPLATTTVLVEDFLPERLDFDLSLPEVIALGDVPRLALQADYLFGAPAAALPVEGELVLRARRQIDAYPGYRFGLYDAPVEPRAASFGGEETAADGAADIALALPEASGLSQPLELTVKARVAELSGRPVERRTSTTVLPDQPMIGIRPAFGDEVIAENSAAAFSLIALAPDLSPQRMDVQWTVNRVETRYQWYRLAGAWNWEPVTTRTRVAQGEATLGAEPVEVSADVDWGQYEIVVERHGGAYVASSVEFYAGWYVPEGAADTPDVLDASLDAESYAPGDTATLRIVPRFAGTALVTVLTNRVVHIEAVEVSEGENLIPLEVTEEWGAGAYVSASVLRPMDVEAGHNPARALGIAYAQVAPGERQLSVSLDVPEEVRPRERLTTGIEIAGLAPGEEVYVTLAAVDVGILNLTAFEAPDPSEHYFGQRRLGVEIRDLYGRLIDGLQGAMGTVRSGGDGAAAMAAEAPPPTEELVALFAGPVRVGPDGRAEIGFELPAFNGTVKLMAVAWSATGVGQASEDVVVRDPVVLSATLPRFLAPGDTSRLLLELTHADGPTGAAEVEIAARGVTLDAPATLTAELEEGGRWVRALGITAGDAGVAEIDIRITTPGGEVLEKSLRLGIEVNDPEVMRISRFDLGPGETFTFNDQVFAGFLPGTGEATLSVGPLARFDAPGLLAALDRYPYGCTEQIAATALPLLYLSDVAEAMELASAPQVAARVNDAIREVLGNQAANGAFGLWGPYSGDLWLDAFVTDFLSRARQAGYAVPDLAFERAMDNLRNRVNYAPDFEEGGQEIAYALMVLAREGAAAVGDLRYFADERAAAFTTPMAAAQLGAALAFYGDQRRADAMVARAQGLIETLPPEPDSSVWRIDYGTQRRDIAAVLALAVEAGSYAVDRAGLSRRLSAALAAGEPSTQEAAWSLLAADALIDDLRETGVTVNGAPPDGPVVRLREQSAGAAPVEVTNGGEATELTVTAFGVPEVPEAAGGNGYAIQRAYYTMEGAPVELTSVAAGTRLVTVLTVTPFGRQEARLMVEDPLPAGFEIDNPNLLAAGDISALDWLDPAYAESAQFRADRFLAAVDWRSDGPFRLAYIARAVSPGSYHHPAAHVEDMYRPQMRARTDPGQVVVTE